MMATQEGQMPELNGEVVILAVEHYGYQRDSKIRFFVEHEMADGTFTKALALCAAHLEDPATSGP